ncbi:SWI/SNF-matrix-actin-related regulator of chromatin subfamily A-like protein 1 [Biomphalaria pfeifferi]|uniref:SWI/SNF-matrix-actin-related regulator of chromatin subfamily A-like protein 1 n=1 Tax=Biomphalaria pfeifferi TaxID=112525 RepID=A0AAD8CC36_BIOPF|nr:SWI/SNF-matrix-actin-related regulator of chromatin subfamily A-like protein 1 [Biomphalaria pfeifferi]
MNGQGLTLEQRQRIEENKRKALSKLAEKRSPTKLSITQTVSKVDTEVTVKVKVTSDFIGSLEVKAKPSSSSNLTILSTKHSSCNETENVMKQFSASNISKQSNVYQNSTTAESHSTVNSGVWTSKSAAAAEKSSVSTKVAFLGLPQAHMKGKCVLINNNYFSVEIGYHGALVEYFKQFKTKVYDKNSKTWSFKLEEYDPFMKGVNNFKPDIEIEALPKWILDAFHPQRCLADTAIAEADLKNVDEILVQTLMPFQRQGVNCAIHHKGRILIADDMGLGKTLQAICIAAYYKMEWPLLVVSPSSVRFDWSQQIRKWLPSVSDINVVETGKDSAVSGLVNIISYDLLSKKIVELKKQMFRVIIMDECHFLKNSKAVRTVAAMPLLKTAKRVVLLSGTPALSRPSELFSQIIAIRPDVFKFHDYGLRYCNAKQMPWGWEYSGSSHMQELQLFLEKKIMIRRMKKDVLSQLPSKTRHLVFLDPHSVKKCKMLNSVSKVMTTSKGQERREMLLQYFHETCRVKLNSVKQYLLDLIESDKKFLIFGHHTEMLDCIEECLTLKSSQSKYIRIDGKTPSEQRSFFCKKFQTDSSYRVAILSITAANAGLNLCAASLVVFAELFWNPGILVQAEDRVHRIGQEDSVCIQYLVAKGTADDYIWPLIQDKLNILSKVGLAKDDFSSADKTFVADSSQLKILNLFKSDFINESQEETKNIETLLTESQSTLLATPKKRLNPKSQYSPIQKRSPFKSQDKEVSPVKRQTSLTSFFGGTPPKKIQRVELTQEETQSTWEESCPLDSPRGTIKNGVTSSQEDVITFEDVNWDEVI